MKLSEWAKSQGIKYQTAFLWFKKGQLPVPAYQTAAYVSVSSHDQESDIE
jgi:putative resolvase